jgi:hypothetical protein
LAKIYPSNIEEYIGKAAKQQLDTQHSSGGVSQASINADIANLEKALPTFTFKGNATGVAYACWRHL